MDFFYTIKCLAAQRIKLIESKEINYVTVLNHFEKEEKKSNTQINVSHDQIRFYLF